MQILKNLIILKEVDFSWTSCLSFSHGAELKGEVSTRILSLSLAPYTSQVAFHRWAGCLNYPAEVTTWQPTPTFTVCHMVGAFQLLPSLPALQNTLLRVHSLAVLFSLSETVWQLQTLNANSMPFSLLFTNSSKMLHLLFLPNPCITGAKRQQPLSELSIIAAYSALSFGMLHTLFCDLATVLSAS